MLELNDKTVFFPGGNYPVAGGHWCFVGEITNIDLTTHLRLTVSDVNSDQTGLVAEWYVDSSQKMAVEMLFRRCQVGHTVFILDAYPYKLAEGINGFRLRSAGGTKIIPLRYSKLLTLEPHVYRPPARCSSCFAPSTEENPLRKCGGCRVAMYDSKACQAEHWKKAHRIDCKGYRGLREILDMEDVLEAEHNDPIFFQSPGPPPNVPRPTILILALGGHFDDFERVDRQLVLEIKRRAKVLVARTDSAALNYMLTTHISAILNTDQGLAEKKHRPVLDRVVLYVKEAGGTAVLSSQFSCWVRPCDLRRMFKESWKLPWRRGSYHHTTHSLMPNRAETLWNHPKLMNSYSMKALHLRGIEPEEVVYGPTEESTTHLSVFAPEPVANLDEAPVVYGKVGKGYLGYIGDGNGEMGSTWATLAMLGIRV
ncbi:hypothetical protein BOTBODRAFT_59263 [Botryobasidium botryosum FD-172 SS1]|uniref:MYND-type domain-containing protein n=1 Tax=Botryobasidium botryosum (strain FD-172 SS1) TaxID=930990 RepID=A0A067M9I7_BOTB1|nr:hypothetical protein BOTBODRAFT_59263 [Botryobasidium botryosum FD-172 SS1]